MQTAITKNNGSLSVSLQHSGIASENNADGVNIAPWAILRLNYIVVTTTMRPCYATRKILAVIQTQKSSLSNNFQFGLISRIARKEMLNDLSRDWSWCRERVYLLKTIRHITPIFSHLQFVIRSKSRKNNVYLADDNVNIVRNIVDIFIKMIYIVCDNTDIKKLWNKQEDVQVLMYGWIIFSRHHTILVNFTESNCQ